MYTVCVAQQSNRTPKTTVRKTTPASRVAPASGQLMRKAGSCACGGGCPRCKDKPQTKLNPSQPGDVLEREADQVADEVLRMPQPNSFITAPQPDDAALVSRAASPSSQDSPETPPVLNDTPGSSGQPLDIATRQFFEPRFGRDFSDVRIHTGPQAAASAHSVDALAYTDGHNVVFGSGEYSPYSPFGRRLLAHELAHVVQQTGGQANGVPVRLNPLRARQVQRFTAAECTASTCAPATRCDTVQGDFNRAQGYVQTAINAMSSTPLAEGTQQAIRWYFHRDADTADGAIKRRLELIETILLLTDFAADFRCDTSADCSGSLAFVRTSTPPETLDFATIQLCELYFDDDDQTRAETLIHEAAHLAGMSVSTDDVYTHSLGFRGLDTTDAMLNADSYALFASSVDAGSIAVSAVFTMGLSGGVQVAPESGDVGWWSSFFIETGFQHPVLHLFNPALRISATFMGMPEGDPGGEPSASLMLGVLPGFRIEEPRPSGGSPYLSVFGGPSVVIPLDEGDPAIGAEVGVGVGYRWSFIDVGAGAAYVYDPTAEEGLGNLVQVGATVSLVLPPINP